MLEREDTRNESNAPLAVASVLVRNHCKSLQSDFAQIVKSLSLKHIRFQAHAFQKAKVLKGFEDSPEKLPRSCNLNFQLSSTGPVAKTPEFAQLKAETDALVSTMSSQLREQILKSMKLEIKYASKTIDDLYLQSLHLFCQSSLIHSRKVTQQDPHSMVMRLIDAYPMVLKYSKLTRNTFGEAYRVFHELGAVPTFTATTPVAAGDGESLGLGILRETAGATRPAPGPALIDQLVVTVQRLFTNTFVDPWERYLSQVDKNNATLEMKKLASSVLTEPATNDAAMEIDDEPTAPRPQLLQLIQSTVMDQNKSLKHEIQSLTSQVANLKNLPRGQASKTPPTSPAPPKKQI